MYRKKIYGKSQENDCYFCEKKALTKNKQGVATCMTHKLREVPPQKCICGEYMDIKESKWGTFFLCPVCGPKSFSKVQEYKITKTEDAPFKLNKKYR
jgi:hypothetical protein